MAEERTIYTSLRESIKSLETTSNKLRLIANRILYVFLVNMALLMIILPIPITYVWYLYACIMLTTAGIVYLLLNFDALRRMGDAEYQSITEELHGLAIKQRDEVTDIDSLSYDARRAIK